MTLSRHFLQTIWLLFANSSALRTVTAHCCFRNGSNLCMRRKSTCFLWWRSTQYHSCLRFLILIAKPVSFCGCRSEDALWTDWSPPSSLVRWNQPVAVRQKMTGTTQRNRVVDIQVDQGYCICPWFVPKTDFVKMFYNKNCGSWFEPCKECVDPTQEACRETTESAEPKWPRARYSNTHWMLIIGTEHFNPNLLRMKPLSFSIVLRLECIGSTLHLLAWRTLAVHES